MQKPLISTLAQNLSHDEVIERLTRIRRRVLVKKVRQTLSKHLGTPAHRTPEPTSMATKKMVRVLDVAHQHHLSDEKSPPPDIDSNEKVVFWIQTHVPPISKPEPAPKPAPKPESKKQKCSESWRDGLSKEQQEYLERWHGEYL